MDALLSGSRRSNVAKLRAQLVLQLVNQPGMTLTRIGQLVGVSKSGVSKIMNREA
jgi:predicted transcriptional regulator